MALSGPGQPAAANTSSRIRRSRTSMARIRSSGRVTGGSTVLDANGQGDRIRSIHRLKEPRSACVFRVALLRASLSAQYGYFGQNKIQYRRFDWRVLRGEHVDLYYYPEEEEAGPCRAGVCGGEL